MSSAFIACQLANALQIQVRSTMFKSFESICPRCAIQLTQRSLLPGGKLLSQRSFASRRGPRTYPKQRPGLTLSDRVADGPSVRQDGVDKRPKRKVDGPFEGMNRTVANIRERPAAAAFSRSRTESRGRIGPRDRRSSGPGGFRALKMQQSLARVGYGTRTKLKAELQEVEKFDQFDLLPQIKEAVADIVLKGMVDIKPTPIQRLAIPVLLGQRIDGWRQRREPGGKSRQNFLLAAETGSGKTMAYLLPCVNAIKTAELEDPDIQAYHKRIEEEKELRERDPRLARRPLEPHPTASRPRMIVLVPTAELVDQVAAVAKSLSHLAKFKVRMLSAKYSATVIRNDLYNPRGVDVIISTPHLLSTVAENEPNILSRVTHLVIDEADTLLDRSFASETTAIIDRASPSLKQLVLCSATIPKRLDSYLAQRYPDIRRITTPNLHAIPRRVQLGVIDVGKSPYMGNKSLACADAIWSIGKDAGENADTLTPNAVDVKHIMVFVNERETTQAVAQYLTTKGIDAVALHRDTPEQRQTAALASFTSSEKLKTDLSTLPDRVVSGGLSKRSLPNTKVIVATDLASRGIDTLAVRNVILYDVPHSTIDFIHRLGRAGRMGRRGRGVVLLGKDDRKDIVAEVRQSMFMGQALI
jgi:ATP-dependent RNA helicase MRH4, mitochondrial